MTLRSKREDISAITSSAAPKKRGGQPGNSNAVKYGLYSQKRKYSLPPNVLANSPEALKSELRILHRAILSTLRMATPETPVLELVTICKFTLALTSSFDNLIRTAFGHEQANRILKKEWTKLLNGMVAVRRHSGDPNQTTQPSNLQIT